MTESDIVRHSAKFERRDGERAWRVLRSFLPLWQQSLLPLWYLITSPGHGTGVRRDRMERNRHERQLTEFVGSHGFLRNSKHGDLVVSCFWSGSRHRAGHDLSSPRLAKGARIGQVDFVPAAFLRGATRGFRHRTLHADEWYRVDRTPLESVASHGDFRTRHLDVSGGCGLRSRGYPIACRQENPCSSYVDRLDRALRGVNRLRADRSRGTRQPRQRPQLHGGYTDVLRRHSSASERHAARSGAAGIIGRSASPPNPRLPKLAGESILTATARSSPRIPGTIHLAHP